jgi:hypothetical protein
MTQTTDTQTIHTIVGRYEKINAANPGTDFAGLTIYIVATEKGTLRAVTSCGPLANYNRTAKAWGRPAAVGDKMLITLDTMRGGHRNLSWFGEDIVGIATVDSDGNAETDGNVPNRKIVRYYCD